MIGEWLALPIMQAAGSKAVGDAVYEEFLYPVASRLLERCDAALRIPGESKGQSKMSGLRGNSAFRSSID